MRMALQWYLQETDILSTKLTFFQIIETKSRNLRLTERRTKKSGIEHGII